MLVFIYFLLSIIFMKPIYAADENAIKENSDFYLNVLSDNTYELQSNTTKNVDTFLIPEDCDYSEKYIKKYYFDEILCDNIVRFTISEEGTYTFSSLEDSRLIIIDNTEHTIEFLSENTFKRIPDKKALSVHI